MKKLINGIEVELNPAEVSEFNAREEAWNADNPQRMIDSFTKALEIKIDATANEKTYATGVSCASYKDSTNTQWAAEAAAFIAWRDSAYAYAYDYLARAQAGEIQNPDQDSFIAGVPAMSWPEAQ